MAEEQSRVGPQIYATIVALPVQFRHGQNRRHGRIDRSHGFAIPGFSEVVA